MDVMEFACELRNAEKDATVGRWAEQFQDFIIRQTIYLGRHTNSLPASLQENYWDILESALEVMPEGSYIEVTPALDRHLSEAAPQALLALIKKRVHVLKID